MSSSLTMNRNARSSVTRNSSAGGKRRTIPWWPRVTRPRTHYNCTCVGNQNRARQTSSQASAIENGSSVASMGLLGVNSPNNSPLHSDSASNSIPILADRNNLSLELTLGTNAENPLDPSSFDRLKANAAGESNYGIRITNEGDLLLMGKKCNFSAMRPIAVRPPLYPYYCMPNWGTAATGMGGVRPLGTRMQQIPYNIQISNPSAFHPFTSQALAVTSQQNSTVPAANNNPNPNGARESRRSVPVPKPVRVKKPKSDNFPSNVRSLLTTGVLEGVVVKYISWGRDKNLRGYIHRLGYRCTCKNCDFKNVTLNAFEFEQHAGSSSKHPNGHIYFSNGKTIYGVVQELQKTPAATLFETLQTITGGSVHQRNFAIWKENFKAACQELHRIEGKILNVM